MTDTGQHHADLYGNDLPSTVTTPWLVGFTAILTLWLAVITGLVAAGMVSRTQVILAHTSSDDALPTAFAGALTHETNRVLSELAGRLIEFDHTKAELSRLEIDASATISAAASEITNFETVLGRPIEVIDGPPTYYDVGEAPTYPWLPDKLAWLVSRDYRTRWNTWYATKLICDKLNSGEAVYGPRLAAAQYRFAQLAKGIDEASERLRTTTKQFAATRKPSASGTLSTEDMRLQANKVLRNAWISTAQITFLVLDVPTLIACLSMTIAAGTRCLLASNLVRTTTLARRN